MPVPAVLLVDDDESTLELIAHVLRDKGYRVLQASTGSEALHVATNYGGPIPLLLTDLAMPDVNGLEVAKRVSTLRPETKVIFITAYGHLYDVGTYPMLSKPFTPEQVVVKVREVLDLSGGGPGTESR